MQINSGKLAIAIALAIGGIGTMRAQNAIDQLQPLVETSAHRLTIAEQVALSKWDSGTAVEDAPREAQVIAGAIKAAEAKGLDSAAVSSFFKAQIEANKVVQYSLLADWRRAGTAPAHTPINLAATIRPKLDQVQTELVDELAATAAIRTGPTCQVDIAKAVGKYLSTHPQEATSLHAIAIDRSLAAACKP